MSDSPVEKSLMLAALMRQRVKAAEAVCNLLYEKEMDLPISKENYNFLLPTVTRLLQNWDKAREMAEKAGR